jgi:hypothetical protein
MRSLIAPTMHKSAARKHTDFRNHQSEVLEGLARLDISAPPPSHNESVAGGMAMTTACDCDVSVSGVSRCKNTNTMFLSQGGGSSEGEASIATSSSVWYSHVSLAFGKVASLSGDEIVKGANESETRTDDAFLEIYIVDTRHQEMCRPSGDGGITRGVMGQYFYHRDGNVCNFPTSDDNMDLDAIAKKTVISEPPCASCFVCSTPLQVKQSLDMHADRLHRDHSDTYDGIFSGHVQTDFEENKNFFLQSHHSWVHSGCTLPCERNLPGVCQKHCPRLNTLASTDVDKSPRFENVCAACVRAGSAPVPLNLAQASTTYKSCMKSTFAERRTPVNAFKQKASTSSGLSNHPNNNNNVTNKTTNRRVNWLTDASTLRKKAAANSRMANLSKKERDSMSAFSFPVDKSGVYTDKVRGTWYCLDVDGKNSTPVCGMPYWDPYFMKKCVWETMDQRELAITKQEEDSQMPLP